MFTLRRTLALGFAVTFLACETVAGPESETTPNFNTRGNPVVGSARGSGSQDNSIRTFAFTALQHLDGTVRGSWERINHNFGQTNGRVTCITFIGSDIAFIGGFAQKGRFSTPPNNGVGWAVLDGGEGQGVNDLATLQFVGLSPGQVNDFCALNLGNPSVFQVFQGNIQVTAP